MSAGAASVRAAITAAATRLTPVSDTARLDAEILMAHALGIDRAALLIDPDRHTLPDSFAGLVARRAAHEPVAYIVGHRDFWTLRLSVGPGVLIPRPDSETLIDAALQHFPDRSAPLRILDLGTGPGTLLLAALVEFSQAQGLGVDISDEALVYARTNAAAAGVVERCNFTQGNWVEGICGQFDLILCNPPYIAEGEDVMAAVIHFEPISALFAGVDGLGDYRHILPELPRLLAPGGFAIVEIGHQQATAVCELAAAAGLATAIRRDLAGRDRAVLCRAA